MLYRVAVVTHRANLFNPTSSSAAGRQTIETSQQDQGAGGLRHQPYNAIKQNATGTNAASSGVSTDFRDGAAV